MDLKNDLKEIFDVENIEDDNILEDFDEYDSLAVLSIIALVENNYHKTLSVKDIRNARTVGGLIKLAEEK